MSIKEIMLRILSILFSTVYKVLEWLWGHFASFMNRQDLSSFEIFSVISCFIIGFARIQISGDVKWYLISIVCFFYLIKFLNVRLTMKAIKRNLDNLNYFKIDDVKDDISFRAQYYRFHFSIIFSLAYFCILLLSPMEYEINDSVRVFNIFIFLLFSIGFFWSALFLVVKFYNIPLTVILVICSVFISYIYLSLVPYVVQEGYAVLKGNLDGFEKINFSIVINYFTIIFSILFQLLIIWIRPVYKLTVTKLTFMYVNVVFSTVTLLLFIFIDDIALKIHESYPMEDLEDISKTLGQFFRIATFPYIAGAVISTLYIEHKSIKAKSKAEKLLFSIMEQLNQKDVLLLSNTQKGELKNNVKRCIFFGGEAYKVPLLCNREIQKLFEKDTISKEKIDGFI